MIIFLIKLKLNIFGTTFLGIYVIPEYRGVTNKNTETACMPENCNLKTWKHEYNKGSC